MRKVAVATVLCLVLAGCQTVKLAPLAASSAAQIQGRSLVVAQYPKADFAAFTAGKAAFALIGAAAMIAEGNKIVAEHNVDDPAAQSAQVIALQLVEQRGMQRIESETITKLDAPEKLAMAYPGADYILDVRTLNWMFAYYPTNWAAYRVIYNARFRLIDARTKKSIAESACSTVQGDDKNPPSKNDLLQNGAALLKDYLAKAAVTCADLISRELLKLGPPSVSLSPAAPVSPMVSVN